MANFDIEFFGLAFPGFQATQKNSRPKFMSRIVGIPLQFHFLEPNIYSRRFSAYGGDQHSSGAKMMQIKHAHTIFVASHLGKPSHTGANTPKFVPSRWDDRHLTYSNGAVQIRVCYQFAD